MARARESVGYRFVELDSTRKTVRFTRPGAELDPGAIGKGYAVDRMVDVLRRAGVESALVNACHSSVYGLGFPPESPRGWMIEIENPDGARDAGPDETVFLKDQSLSTSGSQEKFFEAEGRLYSHIIDPRTARPAEGLLAVSVVASTALESEVWSTAIFVNGLDWASRNKGEGRAVYGCPADGRCRWIGRPY
jgi:thiamine biosynthesis lipoprotein